MSVMGADGFVLVRLAHTEGTLTHFVSVLPYHSDDGNLSTGQPVRLCLCSKVEIQLSSPCHRNLNVGFHLPQ